jgi:alkanesulfonate monooxygenase SsuD/methylene tetrahydromethanopterin reductase-like flavin-dependent oxidoreductase (luciferase family)
LDAKGHLVASPARVLSRIGVGLWTMQSTATAPANPVALYRGLVADAERMDRLGFHSLWTAQHRVWYDGWCPAPLHALALVASRTERLRLATSVITLPQQDPVAFARTAAALDRLSGGRLELGVGLGHRDAEYDAVGVSRRTRGRRMDESLATMDDIWGGNGPPLWIGGMSEAALDRAVRGGHGLILPQSLTADELAERVRAFRARGGTGPVGVMRDVLVCRDACASERFREALDRHYREEIGAWWILKGRIGFAAPEQVLRQLERIQRCALIGDAATVAAGLDALFAAGADIISVRLQFDFVTRSALEGQLDALAGEVASAVASHGSHG